MEPKKSILIKAREIVKAGWTYRTSARDKYGHPCNVIDDNAVRFCAIGASLKASYILGEIGHNRTQANDLLDKAAQELFHHDIITVNDHFRSKKKVLQVYDEAIRRA
jgi:hypothetical protein